MLRFLLLLVILSPRFFTSATAFSRLSPEVSNVIRKGSSHDVAAESEDEVEVNDGRELAEPVRWAVSVNEVAMDTAGQLEADEQQTGQFRTRFCLLASANITIVVIGEKNVSVTIPYNSTVKGECGDVLDDVNEEVEKVVLQWDESNILNMSVTRSGRLAMLSEIQAVVTTGQGGPSHHLETRLQPEDYIVPSWPLRYGFACGKVITFPLYRQDDNVRDELEKTENTNTSNSQQPVAIVQIEDLKMEAFRLDEEYGGNVDQHYGRYTWECEFHKRSDWAPIVVGVGLFALVSISIMGYVLRRRMGCAALTDEGYNRV